MEEKVNILIVDDEESIRKLLVLVCRKHGYETEEAKTGQEAIEKARERFFNVVLLDIKLPDMDGIELISPIKSKHPNTAVIMITGYTSVDTAVRSWHNEASAYIIKPLDIDELLATVKEVIEKQRLGMENRKLLEALRKNEEKYRLVTDNITDLVSMCDRNAAFTYVSPSYKTILGYDTESLIGSPVVKLVHPDDLHYIEALIKEKTERLKDASAIFRIRHKDGYYLWFECHGRFLFDYEGKLKGTVFDTREITKRKRSEEELKKRLDQLEIYYEATIGREGRIIELKHEVNEVLKKLGEKNKYMV